MRFNPLLSLRDRCASRKGRREPGVTLIELIIATTMLSLAVILLGQFFPKSTRLIWSNRFRWTGNNLANNLLFSTVNQPYANIVLSSSGTGNYFLDNTNDGYGCDCATVNFSTFPVTDTVAFNGLTYTRQVCINQILASGTSYQTYCPSANDTHLKNIRVHVTWRFGGSKQTVDVASLVAE